MTEVQEWMALAKPDPEFEEWCKQAGQTPDIGLFPNIQALRQWIINQRAVMTATMGAGGGVPGVKETDHQVPTRDGQKITCRTYQPEKAPAGGSPLYVMFHGGGFCIGGLENEELLCRLMCSKFGVVAVNVDYRLAPEHKFPMAVHDSFDATKWAAENASSLGANTSKAFLIGGTSAGGNLAAVTVNTWRDEGHKPAVTGMHLMVPALCASAALPEKYRPLYKSYEQNANAPILGEKAIDLFIDNYIPDKEERKNPLFSPMVVPTGYKGLPPTYFQVCGQDPLRDEALIFEKILREEEGIKTKLDLYPGLPHGFWAMVPTLKASEKFVQESLNGIEWLLQQS